MPFICHICEKLQAWEVVSMSPSIGLWKYLPLCLIRNWSLLSNASWIFAFIMLGDFFSLQPKTIHFLLPHITNTQGLITQADTHFGVSNVRTVRGNIWPTDSKNSINFPYQLSFWDTAWMPYTTLHSGHPSKIRI